MSNCWTSSLPCLIRLPLRASWPGFALWVALVVPAPADEPAPSAYLPPESHPGALVIAGGGELPPAVLERFLELGGGESARLVVIPTASSLADRPSEEIENWFASWRQLPVASVTLLHTRSRETADARNFVERLKTATAVWFIGGDQNKLSAVYCGTRTETALHEVLERGGVIGGTSAGAAIMSRVMISGGRDDARVATGLGFVSGAIIDQHFSRRNRLPRLMSALENRPGHVGIGIDESTAVVVRHGKLEVIGNAAVTLCLAPSHNRAAFSQNLISGESQELHAWRLAATARARFGSYAQAQDPPVPNVRQGTLIITGNNTPREAVTAFLEGAGGFEAPVLLVSQMKDGSDAANQKLADQLREVGAVNVQVLNSNNKIDFTDPKIRQTLEAARGVWLVGSQEQQMMELVVRSPLRQVVENVLDRGGAIGGSAAGACMQGDGMVRRGLGENQTPTFEASECGLGLLAGVVISEHAEPEEGPQAQARQMATVLKERFPNCVGLGLKDSAAVVVRGHTMKVLGSDSVALVTQNAEADTESPYEMIRAGQEYDLSKRRLIAAAEEEPAAAR